MQQEPLPSPHSPTRTSKAWGLIAKYTAWTIALVIGVSVPLVVLGDRFDLIIRDWMTAPESSLAVAAIGIALLVADLLLAIPSALVIALMGGLIGSTAATVAGTIGLSLACVWGFLLGRSVGRDFSSADEREQKEFTSATAMLKQYGAVALVVARPVPILAEISVIAAAALGMPAAPVLITTTLANFGIAALYAFVGATAEGWLGIALVFAAATTLPALALLTMHLIRQRSRN
ncbi:VTT domain-containing protein [Hyphomicrobium sp. D-2]|uniref:VTT domain-containing protein n=1 Tax=Hyphomicrobium sp. D-2 TaxID=3041621 RepID=UPI002454E626|nr:VTT domain-containing protein [Hyphomicrobium sp. D-2]MDH4981259.1 VTT domain-containing protein [Hyphomicrobium sp. D-2]